MTTGQVWTGSRVRHLVDLRQVMACVVAATAVAFCSAADARDPQSLALSRLVDPRIGNGNDDQGDTIPGPTVPGGSIHPSPDTLVGSNAGYDAGAPISGFAQLHVQGSGGRTSYGTLLISPQTGAPALAEWYHLSPKAREEVAADHYAVTLARYGIRAEVTPAPFAVLYRFTYPAGRPATMVFDITRKIRGELASEGAEAIVDPRRGRLTAHVRAGTYWNPAPIDMWFVVQMDRPATRWGVENDGKPQDGAMAAQSGAGKRLVAWWQFDADRPVMMKVAVSFTSADRAAELLAEDLPDWDYDRVRRAAGAAWDKALSRITIEGVGDADRRRFYTALYHTMVQPRDRTRDQPAIDRATPLWDDHYTLWDTYRTAFPLMALIRQRDYAGNVASLIATWRREGAAHTAFIGRHNYQVGQGGDEADNVLGEALVRHVPGIDWPAAAAVASRNAREARRPRYLIQGYFGTGDPSPEPDNERARSGSSTLGFALNDHYAALLAAEGGRPEEAAALRLRERNWRNVWDAQASSDGFTGFILPRRPDGRFADVDPKQGWDGKAYDNVGFYEGTAWIYSFGMLHDIPGMIAAMGGRERFVARLSHALESGLIDITNEPSFATPWLFIDAGRPDLASYWANRVFQRFTPDAYPGDEDGGAMGSHYVFNRLGLFPKLTTDLYYLHAPHQPRSVLHLENGNSFAIVARNWQPSRIYITAARLNGRPLAHALIDQATIMRGGTLELTLSARPGSWGRTPAGDGH